MIKTAVKNKNKNTEFKKHRKKANDKTKIKTNFTILNRQESQ